MNENHFNQMKTKGGFIAALDQSGGSTPKALAAYGVTEDQYTNEDEMFDLVHQMRTRIITSPAFSSDKIIGAILFEQTMDREIEGKYTGDYLAEKGVVPFLKVDKGLADQENGVQMMKPIHDLDETLRRANERKMFGTKCVLSFMKRIKKVLKQLLTNNLKSVNALLKLALCQLSSLKSTLTAKIKNKLKKC